MALTRLKNIITSRTGRIIYVNPDDFDASDAIDNRGNSALRPFKSIQRAFLEVARFSYRVGLSNDEFDAFSIMLYPAEYVVDNRPGEVLYTNVAPIDENSNLDLTSPNNVLYKYNSVEGGIIVPRGASLVGTDLRRTKIIPKYVPYPTVFAAKGINTEDQVPSRTSIFKVTGGTYFWQFSFFDGAEEGVYFKPDSVETLAPKFSHHRLTCFEFADGVNSLSTLISQERVPNSDYSAVPNILERTDLEIYYQKVSKAFASIPDTSGDPAADQIQARVEENRIVGPISDEYRVLQITRNGNTATAVTVDEFDNPRDHGFSVGVNINISGVTGSTGPQSELDASLYNGSFTVTSASGNIFTYQMIQEPTGNAVGSNITVKTEIDTVDSASPYAFNLSLRSVWGMNGMLADGSRATGFKSMVVAQFTGLSLQKDDRAFVRYNESTGNYDVASAGDGAHLDGFAEYRKGWAHRHIVASNDAFIQAVSVFAVGYGSHFTCESGADMSITNSNSNFGNTALRAAGFKAKSFSKDKAGEITHIVPPKALNVISTIASGASGEASITLANDGSVNGVVQGMTVTGDNIGTGATVVSVNTNTRIITLSVVNSDAVNGNVIFGEETSVNWVNIDIQRTKVINQSLAGAGGTPGTRLYLYGYTAPAGAPTTRVQGYTVGARQDGTGVSAIPDKINCLLVAQGATEATVQSAFISPYGPSVSGLAAGVAGSPIQYDSNTYTISGVAGQVGGWYLSVDSVDNDIYTTLSTNTRYNNVNFTPTTFLRRIPDPRDLADRTFRIRLKIDKDKTNPLPRDPLSGYVLQPLNSDSTNYKLDKTFYIYDIEKVQEFERGVSDGLYYITLLCASITPSTSNFNDRKFSQNVNEVYPTFDRDNPVADPNPAVSVADNETIGLVYSTDGATPTPNKDPKRSITKEAIKFLLTDTGWTQPGTTPNFDSVNNRLSNVELTARAGDEEVRKINIRENNDGTVAPIPVEFRRHSILRSGNHTFEYLGFGPGNYSTAFPQTQVETLSADQVKFSQSIKEEAGVAFYSGLNSNGDLFIGNQVINPVTGQITNEDIAQLNVVGEENTTIETFSELVLTDKLTVIGGASNQLESIFAGPVTFQGQVSSTSNLIAKKITYNNQDGTVIKQTLLAPEDALGQPDFTNITGYTTPSDGDLVYNINWTPGKSLGWIYYQGLWKEFGITDTGQIDIQTFVDGDGVDQQHLGFGVAANSTYRANILGNVRIDGNLTTTGTGGISADKYVTRTYTGDGNTLTYNITTFTGGVKHTADSLLVFLNGVAQIGGTNFSVDANGANIIFGAGDAPLSTDTIHIIELPI
ncbi:tail fiber protein [Synechococcus phage S-RIM8]|uniref:Tail fiber protein n=1 Tax=Synechococcus phage S-RIM8 TaxID=756278 RepID=A0A1D7SCC9_9CAUD|nr:tail fiber protein [Synechococcus phage S-RIM8]AOO10844.1 tail fiber protein [Synechococcus phage S-RIM8]AOO11290.1 tail fiber protein [Synechococcus phage S-RIM8]QBQ75142.1 tail fiber protein [Synechococcus phage S-RIM8]QBQ75805.1 tail fiber protein [Synechococcus phage S-RIM8]